MEIKIERHRVSKKIRFLAWLTAVMGGLFFAYPVFYLLYIFSGLEKYYVPVILSHLNRVFFLEIPSLAVSYVPAEANGYVAFSIIYVLFGILLMIISNFLLERNLLAIAFSLVIFTSLSISEYIINIRFMPYSSLAPALGLYFTFSLIPLILIILEIIIEKDYKKEQLYVKIISSFVIIAVMILSFKGLIWMIQNKQWLIDTFS